MLNLIERELLEVGYTPKKIYKFEDITINLFDMGLTEIYKENKKIKKSWPSCCCKSHMMSRNIKMIDEVRGKKKT
jgi:DUF438 domain-containing protein